MKKAVVLLFMTVMTVSVCAQDYIPEAPDYGNELMWYTSCTDAGDGGALQRVSEAEYSLAYQGVEKEKRKLIWFSALLLLPLHAQNEYYK